MISVQNCLVVFLCVAAVRCQYDEGLKKSQNPGPTPPPFLPAPDQAALPPPPKRGSCPAATSSALKAVVVIKPGAGNATGVLTFTQADADSPVLVNGRLENVVPAGLHGFHVHQFGNLSDSCTSAGSHYNPNNYTHAGPSDTQRHVGDLGNIKAGDDGTVDVSITDSVISLTGPCSVVGRAMVVHLKTDDLGKGGDAESLKTGNAGGRIGCGVIGWA